MDITCDKCKTEYVLDDTLISVSGTKVRCMTCDHVFKVYRNSDSEADQWVLRQTHGPIRTFTKLAKIQQWISEGKVTMDDLISRKNGPWKKIGDIAELKALFEQTKAKRKRHSHPPGLIKLPSIRNKDATKRHGVIEPSTVKSKTLEKPVSEKPTLPPASKKPKPPTPPVPDGSKIISEAPTPLATPKSLEAEKYTETKPDSFEGTFPVADPTRRTFAGGASDPAIHTRGRATFTDKTPKSPIQMEKQGPDLSQIPVDGEKAHWESGEKIGMSDPQWTGSDASKKLPRFQHDEEPLPPKRHLGRYIALGVVGLLLVVGLFCFLFVPEIGNRVLSQFDTMVTKPQPDRHKRFFDRGQESFLLDSDAAFLQADREFQKVLALEENHPATLAALSKLYCVWAQYIRDAKLDAMTDAVETEGEDSAREVKLLERAYLEKLGEATHWAGLAQAADSKSRTVLLSFADIHRMKGELEKASEFFKKASEIRFDSEAEYLSVLIDIEKQDPPKSLVKRLTELVADKPMIRAVYRQARVLASIGEKEKAIAAIDRLLTLNANHERARELKIRMSEEKPVWLVEADKSDPKKAPKKALAKEEKKKSGRSRGDGEMDKDHSVRGISGMLLRAKRLRKRGEHEEARKLYEKIIDMSPTNLDAHSDLGYYYIDKGNTGRAIASFRRCLTVSPKYGPAIIGLAETYKFMGQKDQALKYYQSYVQINPTGSQADMARRNIDRLGVGSMGGALSTSKTDPPEEPAAPEAEEKPAESPPTPSSSSGEAESKEPSPSEAPGKAAEKAPAEESKNEINNETPSTAEPADTPKKEVILLDNP